MKSFDVHVYHTRTGHYMARVTCSGEEAAYIGPDKNLSLLLYSVQRHMLLLERD